MIERVKRLIVRLKTWYFRWFPYRGAVVKWQYGTSLARRGCVTSIRRVNGTVLVTEYFQYDDGEVVSRSEWHHVSDLTLTDLPSVTRIIGRSPLWDQKVPDKLG